jgi:Na+-transporting NADH:ubiquinone oxidoreductase subunit NqrB
MGRACHDAVRGLERTDLAASLVICEVLLVAGAIWLAPDGLTGRRLVTTAMRAAAGGMAMVVVAKQVTGLHPFVCVLMSVFAYTAVLVAVSGRGSTPAMVEEIRCRFVRTRGP